MNKLIDECNNRYLCSIGKKPIHADYSVVTKEIESSHKTLKFKVGSRVRITKSKNISSKHYAENWLFLLIKIFVIDYVVKANPWAHEIKNLNEGKIKGNFQIKGNSK